MGKEKPIMSKEQALKQQKERATLRVREWLTSPSGRRAIADTRQNYPVWASNPITLLGFALGKHAKAFDLSFLDLCDSQLLSTII